MLKYGSLVVVVFAGCASAPKPAAPSKSAAGPVKQTEGVPMPNAASAGPMPRVIAKATDAHRGALLDRVKGMEGEWEMQGEDGKWAVAAVFRPIAAGSAVREIMFPGSPHEMTNLYHMDGNTLVMTHYCAAGNQPTMRAKANGLSTPIEFNFDSVSNLTQPDEMYMGSMTLVFIDADHAEQRWMHHKAGKMGGEPTVFTLRRKK